MSCVLRLDVYENRLPDSLLSLDLLSCFYLFLMMSDDPGPQLRQNMRNLHRNIAVQLDTDLSGTAQAMSIELH